MSRRNSPILYSELPLSKYCFDSARVVHHSNELSDVIRASCFHFDDQTRRLLWNNIMRGLASSESPLAPLQQQEQHTREYHDSASDVTKEAACFTSAAIKRSKTNSERSRAFRARRKKYEDSLRVMINSLRQEVADLDFLRNVRAGKVLTNRNDMCGSLVRLTREYYALFERGMPSVRGVGSKRPVLCTDETSVDSSGDGFTMKQETFIMSAMDAELQFDGASGRDSLLDQWKKYTSYHSSFNVELIGMEVSGEEDDPIVTVYADLHVVFSHATFEHIFPHVLDNKELVNKFIGREIIYHSTSHFQFSPEGQILVYDSNVGFVDALIQAGASVSDVALLAQQARIAGGCRIGGEDDRTYRVQRLKQDSKDDIVFLEYTGSVGSCDSAVEASSDDEFASENNEIQSEAEDMRSPDRSRFTIDFLLS